jgi:hypothetical protein
MVDKRMKPFRDIIIHTPDYAARQAIGCYFDPEKGTCQAVETESQFHTGYSICFYEELTVCRSRELIAHQSQRPLCLQLDMALSPMFKMRIKYRDRYSMYVTLESAGDKVVLVDRADAADQTPLLCGQQYVWLQSHRLCLSGGGQLVYIEMPYDKPEASEMESMAEFEALATNGTWWDVQALVPRTLPANLVLVKGPITHLPLWTRGTDRHSILCHQGNCVAVKARGITKSIFKAFPFADIYRERKTAGEKRGSKRKAEPDDRLWKRGSASALLQRRDHGADAETRWCRSTVKHDVPGKVVFRRMGSLTIASMLAQENGGRPREQGRDSSSQRETWFAQCLRQVAVHAAAVDGDVSVAFPWRVGCVKDGWNRYLDMLCKLAANQPRIRVVLVYSEEQEPEDTEHTRKSKRRGRRSSNRTKRSKDNDRVCK